MKPALSLRPVAAAEIQDAFRWYEQQRKGLGEEFLQALRETFSAIETNPAQYPRIRRAGLVIALAAILVQAPRLDVSGALDPSASAFWTA